jgi:pyruvate formate lyase activating enzyme
VLKGRTYTVEALIREIEKDRPFYERSDGGVTLSGGEPLSQASFCREVLGALRHRGIHTVVDTSGYVPWRVLAEITPRTDLFLYDVKCFDGELHRRLTGVDNRRIKSNLRKLLKRGTPVIVRIPVIPGCNDSPAELERVAEMIVEGDGATTVHLLPYHRFAEQKYGRVGRPFYLGGLAPPPPDQVRGFARIFEKRRIPVVVMGLEE